MALLSRKGVAGFTDFVRIVFWVIVFAMFAVFFYAVAKSLLGGGGDRSSKQNFVSLADNVQLMIDKPSSFAYQRIAFYLDEEHYIFGFMSADDLSLYKNSKVVWRPIDCTPTANGEWVYSKDTEIIYPSECQDKPCLCLYNKLKNFPSKPVLCKSFDNQDNQVIFHGSAQPSQSRDIAEPLESPWQDPSFYSDYPIEIAAKYRYLFLSYSCKKAQSLYIEKFAKDNKIHIFITPDISQEDMSKRISTMAECPSTSDPECVGKVVNSFVSVNPESYCFYDDNENKCVLKKEVTRCEFDKKVGKDCLCGDKYASAADYGNVYYCLKNKDAYALMPFLCSQITSCADYCKISDPLVTECIGEERAYCEEDFCTKGCQVDGSGKNVVCKNKA